MIMMRATDGKDPINMEYLGSLTGKELFDLVIEAVRYGYSRTGVCLDIIRITEETYMSKFIWIEQRLKEHGIALEIV